VFSEGAVISSFIIIIFIFIIIIFFFCKEALLERSAGSRGVKQRSILHA
jgi:hypothetical protein